MRTRRFQIGVGRLDKGNGLLAIRRDHDRTVDALGFERCSDKENISRVVFNEKNHGTFPGHIVLFIVIDIEEE